MRHPKSDREAERDREWERERETRSSTEAIGRSLGHVTKGTSVLVAILGSLQVTRYKQDSGGPCRTCSGRRYQGTTAASAAGPPGERAVKRPGAAAPLARLRRRPSVQSQWYTCEIYFREVISTYGDTRRPDGALMAFNFLADGMDVSFDLSYEIRHDKLSVRYFERYVSNSVRLLRMYYTLRTPIQYYLA